MLSRTLGLSLALAMLVTGCKVTVMVPRGGDVQSTASGTCLELTNCVHDIVDSTYTESFTAAPKAGFQFIKWNQPRQCADIPHIGRLPARLFR